MSARAVAVAVMAVLSGPVWAQDSPPTPAVPGSTVAPTPPTPEPSAGKLHTRLPRAMLAPFEHVEGTLAFLRAELAITDAQMPQWDAFAAALRAGAAEVRAAVEKARAAGAPTTAPERMRAQVDALAARLEAARRALAAATDLYAVLTPAQRRTADALTALPIGRL